ncbi:MAG: TIGR00153 family protein [Syntrophobacteria bacterium]|jgi:predicted phosphate transport protein (TIGR00153 family)
MFLKKIFDYGKKEERVIENIKKHLELLCNACDSFHRAMEENDNNLAREVVDSEREGDSIRRDIIANIYAGAFLPYLRPDLCRFAEIVDRIFDSLQETALNYLEVRLPENIRDECVRVAFLNARMCEMLLISFEAILNGEDLREKALAIRIYEKKIDDIEFSIVKDLRQIPVDDFWQGRLLADFVSTLTSISDTMEDAGDHLQIINVSMKS